MSIAYIDGTFMPLAEVRVSPLDRGYLLADGVYEIIPAYAGKLFRPDEHLRRLDNSLSAIRIANPHTAPQWLVLLETLVERNGGQEQSLYIQVTRGVAPRNHAFPSDVSPSVFAMSRMIEEHSGMRPLAAVTREDNRWGRCDIKSIALLPNVLLRQSAVDAGAAEAILIRDGQLTEGAASNVFTVTDEFIVTPPESPMILPGITRALVLELAEASGLPVVEAVVAERALRAAREIWLTSSTLEVSPVIQLDGKPVGGGRPGPVWKKMSRLFAAFKSRVHE